MQRGRGEPDALRVVINAVRAEVARHPIYRIEDETHPGGNGLELPIASCSEIVDRPLVRAAIRRAERALARAYREPR